MTREELAQRINLFEKSSRRRDLVGSVLMICGLAAICLPAVRFIDTYPFLGPVCLCMMLACLAFPLLFCVKAGRKKKRGLGLHCPGCDTGLTRVTGRLAVTRGDCDGCGKMIVDEGTCDPVRPLMNAEEISQRMDSFNRGRRRREWQILACMFGGMFIALLVTAVKTHPFLGSAAFLMMLGSIFLPPHLALKAGKRQIKALGLSCPECDADLIDRVGEMAVNSGYCNRCGKKIAE
ncbi:MAG: hypothetical protein EOP88_23380 [Verrucomicrobiaceae bacterium]|nr:MAG: hypothetical protein EOP88_23380 [Verrucomicrobiaceae bacterium]